MASTWKSVGQALAHLSPSGVRAEAWRTVTIGLTAAHPARYGLMEAFFAPPGLETAERIEALRRLFHTGLAGAPERFDLEIQDETLPPRAGAYDFRFDAPETTVKRILEDHGELELALARAFRPFREQAGGRIVARISRENALFALATALPNVVPSLVSLPWAVGEFASDTAILTANQVRMAFLLAAAHGRDPGYLAQKGEIGSIVAGAFGWRALARELVGKMPAGAGLIPKAAVAYAGTFVVGRSLLAVYRRGRGLSRQERRREYAEALARGRRLAAGLLEEAGGGSPARGAGGGG